MSGWDGSDFPGEAFDRLLEPPDDAEELDDRFEPDLEAIDEEHRRERSEDS